MNHNYYISRRSFLRHASILTASMTMRSVSLRMFAEKDVIIGHGAYRYKVDMNWGLLDSSKFPVKDCHEMVYTKAGNIILLTNDIRNNILMYNKDGTLVKSWGKTYPGGHGLTLMDEGGEEFLYITDTVRHEVIKTDLDGKEVLILPFPRAAANYTKPEEYLPTETAIASNGDIYVADGYGSQYIIKYNQYGRIEKVFGGRGEQEDQFFNAHGIAIDSRNGKERLLITARQQNKLKYFAMDGTYESSIHLDGAYICRPVIKDDTVYLATIWSGNGSSNTGFVSILNKENQLVSAPGGCMPKYTNGKLNPLYQTLQIFKHPHDVCIDEDENMYVCQWNAGNSYPIKLIRV